MTQQAADDRYTLVEPSYSVSYSYSPQGYGPMLSRRSFFSSTELVHIAIAVSVLVAAFTLVLMGGDYDNVLAYLGFAVVAVLLGFFVHEMAHKIVARKYGCWAEFRADMRGLLFALVFSFFGFLFAAPGAVYILGNVSREQNGKISLAGPGSNLAIAGLVAPFALLALDGVPALVEDVAFSLYFFSTFLAIFNLIPVAPLDGSKIWAWSKPIFLCTIAVAGLMFVLAWL